MIQTVNTELIKLVMWLNINKLSLNTDKTKYIIFSIKTQVKDMPDVTIGANVVERVKSIKFLEVIIDENVSWTEHIYYIKNKISKGIGILCKARKVLKPSTLLIMYYSFIYPYLNYCIELCGSSSSKLFNSVFKLQKRVIRIVSASNYRAHTETMRKGRSWQKSSQVYSLPLWQHVQ